MKKAGEILDRTGSRNNRGGQLSGRFAVCATETRALNFRQKAAQWASSRRNVAAIVSPDLREPEDTWPSPVRCRFIRRRTKHARPL